MASSRRGKHKVAVRTTARKLQKPVFAQAEPTPDPSVFRVRHASDAPAYKLIDELNREHKIAPLPFPPPRGVPEPRLTLTDVLGGNASTINAIIRNGQLVFHATGDCGSTRGPATQNQVTDKMLGDFQEAAAAEVPQFNLLLGDIVYSFGETQYYYDQFYEPYRNYPAPILAVAGNHDGMLSPLAHAVSLDAYLRNFCSSGFVVTPEAGALSRTAQIQPGVFFTFDAPFVRILTLYSNTLEDPGVIANSAIGGSQQTYLRAALTRVKSEGYAGALIIAHHHPPYTAGGTHGWSLDMQAQIDTICSSRRSMAARSPVRTRAQLPALHAHPPGRRADPLCSVRQRWAQSRAVDQDRCAGAANAADHPGGECGRGSDRVRELRLHALRLPAAGSNRRAAANRISPGRRRRRCQDAG